jgi:hypothetical protein
MLQGARLTVFLLLLSLMFVDMRISQAQQVAYAPDLFGSQPCPDSDSGLS